MRTKSASWSMTRSRNTIIWAGFENHVVKFIHFSAEGTEAQMKKNQIRGFMIFGAAVLLHLWELKYCISYRHITFLLNISKLSMKMIIWVICSYTCFRNTFFLNQLFRLHSASLLASTTKTNLLRSFLFCFSQYFD